MKIAALVSASCPADIDDDGDVDGMDLYLLIQYFGRSDCSKGSPCTGDLNADNSVDPADLSILAACFGRTDCLKAEFYFYHNDHLGTSLKITDSSGKVVWKGNYLPFGKVNMSTGNVTNLFRFPGQYEDPETNLYYNWHRYYQPEIGRYLRPDPMGLEGGINLYAYVMNNPVNGIDPNGLILKNVWEKILYSNWSISGYLGGGAEISNKWIECCKNNKRYLYHTLIICSGIGAGAAFPEIPSPSSLLNSFGGQSNENCPRNNDWFVAKSGSASFYVGGGYQVDVGRNEGFGGNVHIKIGGIAAEIVFLKVCSITVCSKVRIGDCCE